MLLTEALIRIWELWDQDRITQLPDNLLGHRIPVTLVQILNRTLMGQCLASSGELQMPLETTSYAILTLKVLSPLPWPGNILEEILSNIRRNQQILHDSYIEWSKPQYLWVEKVTYGSTFLSEAYCLAATYSAKQSHTWTTKVESLLQVPLKEDKKVTHLFRQLRCFESEPAWKMHACVLEGLFFLPELKSAHSNILRGEQSAKNEYLSFIPCTWVAINNMQNLFHDTYLLWDMMVLTLCNFRVDEYMEATVAKLSESELKEAKNVIKTLCERWEGDEDPLLSSAISKAAKPSSTSNSPPTPQSLEEDTSTVKSTISPILADIRVALLAYISTTLGHPRIACAPQQARSALNTALQIFLNAHIDQSLTNTQFASKKPIPHSFNHWLHTIAAPSVSAPFSFAFLTCLIGGLPSSMTQYIGTDFGSRVAIMSRMYNDLGSIARDRVESNLNCTDFPELNDGGGPADTEVAKGRLEDLAQYEREAAQWVTTRLVSALESEGGKDGRRKTNAVRLFSGVAELYADVYMVKDLSNRQNNRK